MSGYVSPYAPADSSTPPPTAGTYVSPYAPAPATTTKPLARNPTTPFTDPKRKPMVDTSGIDKSIAQQDAAVTKPVAGAFSALQRVPDAWDATLTRGNPGSVLTGSASDEDKAATAAKIDAALKRFPGGDNPTIRGAYHLGMNPLNLLDLPLGAAAKGRSLAQLGTDALEGHGFNAATKIGAAASKAGAKPVTDLIAKAHDLLGVHSAAKRELANLHGAQWIDKYAEYRARLMQMGGKPDPALDAQAQAEAKATSAPPPAKKPHFTAADVAAMNRRKTAPPVHGPATINTNAFAIPASKTGRIRNWPTAGFPDRSTPKFSPEDEKIFGLMTDPSHGGSGGKNALMDLASIPSDFLTGGMFVQPVGHMANISGLGAMTDPLAVAKALGTGTKDNAKKLVGALTGQRIGGGESEAAIAARHGDAQRGGAISTHKNERANPLDATLSGASDLASKVPGVGQALSLVPKAVKGLYRASGDILWKFDDEVKANRFQNLVDGGMEPNRAGLRVGGELVDYENKSPAARALRPVAPFATWRTKAPLAVARNAVENPGKTSALSNAVPAAMGGSQGQDADSGKPYISSLPGAEFNGATSGLKGAGKYALGTEGTVPKIGMDTVGWLESLGLPNTPRGRAEAKKLRTQATYGKEAPEFLANELPIISQALQYGSGGMFNKGQAPSTLNDLLSLLRVRPGTP